jgi:transposase
VRTYAPRGETPVLRYPYWEHLSMISAITPEGNFYTMMQEQAFDSTAVVRFLKHLLRQIPGKLLIVWDRLPAHRSNAVKDFLRQGGTERVYLAQIPSYAPELNPDEGVWNYLKRVELRNVCCHDLPELHSELRKAVKRLRRKTTAIQGFVHQVYPDICV